MIVIDKTITSGHKFVESDLKYLSFLLSFCCWRFSYFLEPQTSSWSIQTLALYWGKRRKNSVCLILEWLFWTNLKKTQKTNKLFKSCMFYRISLFFKNNSKVSLYVSTPVWHYGLFSATWYASTVLSDSPPFSFEQSLCAAYCVLREFSV